MGVVQWVEIIFEGVFLFQCIYACCYKSVSFSQLSAVKKDTTWCSSNKNWTFLFCQSFDIRYIYKSADICLPSQYPSDIQQPRPFRKDFITLFLRGRFLWQRRAGTLTRLKSYFIQAAQIVHANAFLLHRRLCNFSLDLSIFKKQNKGFKGRSGYRGLPRFPLCLTNRIRICRDKSNQQQTVLHTITG